jgi:uncharacterized membrane protein YedE/YeeE
MTEFEPLRAAIGGALIGLSVTLLMLLNGRLAGISGIFADLVSPATRERSWQLAFIVGLVGAPLLSALAGYPLPMPRMPESWAVVVGGGLLVGVGTRLSNGCTSGHGICGTALLRPRSITATLIFMATAIVVVWVMRHGMGA